MVACDCEYDECARENSNRFFRPKTEEKTMRIKINKDSDTLYFRLDENSIVESEEVRPGVILDFDKNDKVVGVEFLGVSERATDAELSTMQFQTA